MIGLPQVTSPPCTPLEKRKQGKFTLKLVNGNEILYQNLTDLVVNKEKFQTMNYADNQQNSQGKQTKTKPTIVPTQSSTSQGSLI